MGQHHSSATSNFDLTLETGYLVSHTKLTEAEILELYNEYAKKNKMTKKEFLSEFRKTFPHAMDPNAIAKRVFDACDLNKDGVISFVEFIFTIHILTKAPKEEKLERVFAILDLDCSGFLSCNEVVQAVKQSYNILGRLNQDFNRRGIEVFRQLDSDGDMKVTKQEFIDACLGDAELCTLLETSLGEDMWIEKEQTKL